MSATVLVLNCGSSSIKYALYEPVAGEAIASGTIERIGEAQAVRTHRQAGERWRDEIVAADHVGGMAAVVEAFSSYGPDFATAGLAAVGHRVVMGGAEFSASTLIDDQVIDAIDRLSVLAPLHNPANLAGIRVAMEIFDSVPHVAVFDTAFFAGLAPEATTYAIDREVAERYGIRRYGFHGTSHRYVSGRVASLLGRDDLRQVVLHLGNGASASAVVGGQPVATTMGLTPLEGLVMGTRSGDLDPAIVIYLQREAQMSVDEVDTLLNRRSGLAGMCGHNDLRDVHEAIAAGDEATKLALDVYVRRIRHYLGAYTFAMGGIDVVTFTAGVGEHDEIVRSKVIAGLDGFGLSIDPALNAPGQSGERTISPAGSPVTVMVIPTDEELAISRDALAVVSA